MSDVINRYRLASLGHLIACLFCTMHTRRKPPLLTVPHCATLLASAMRTPTAQHAAQHAALLSPVAIG